MRFQTACDWLPVCVSSPISQVLWLGNRGRDPSDASQWPRPPRAMWLMKEAKRGWEGFLQNYNHERSVLVLTLNQKYIWCNTFMKPFFQINSLNNTVCIIMANKQLWGAMWACHYKIYPQGGGMITCMI